MITSAFSNILKLFLPSWNFFNDFSAVPRLDARTLRDGHESDWQPLCAVHSTRSLGRVFFNARGNLELLEKTFIDRATEEFAPECPRPRGQQSDNSDGINKYHTPLISDAAAPGDGRTPFERSAHHDTLVRILRRRMGAARAGDEFQFRLVMTNPGEADAELFVSGRHPAKEETR